MPLRLCLSRVLIILYLRPGLDVRAPIGGDRCQSSEQAPPTPDQSEAVELLSAAHHTVLFMSVCLLTV